MERGFQADAFQADAFLTGDVPEEGAFQADAFQSDAFQMISGGGPPPTVALYRMFLVFG